jgi:DNA polymerase type B, organellar and viral
MKRFAHYLKPNERSETISHCIFVDTETDEIALPDGYKGHKLRFGWACSVKRAREGHWGKTHWKKFLDPEEFWIWANTTCASRHKAWMWCHNSSFDYPVLDAFRLLPKMGWNLYSAIIDAPPTIVQYRCETKTLVLCDTLNIWRMSLLELGKKIGVPKLKMPTTWGVTSDDDTYCQRDVQIIMTAVTDWADWLRDNDMGGFSPTIAAQAMRSFRHRWLDDRILIENNDLSLSLARDCYHGGRCEAHFIGRKTEPVHSLDVNSMYPYVMATCQMPVRLKGISYQTQVHHLPKLLEQYCLCAHVRLKTQDPAYPVILNGKLCFPVGEFDCHLTTPEIEHALHGGSLVEIHLCAAYERGAPFRRFALELYNHKEEASRAGRLVEERQWKLLLNSFYGKWGQNGRHWVPVGTCDPRLFRVRSEIDAQTLKQTHFRDFGGITLKRAEDSECLQSHPAIAAHITAHARMILFTLIGQLSPQDYLYCDTDGLLVLEPALDQLRDRLDNYKLGSLKRVAAYSDVTVYGCKDLVLDGKATLKGIRREAQNLALGEYRQIKWSSLRGLLGLNSLDMPRTLEIDKTLCRIYTKGIVGPDGYVSPIHLTAP